MGDVTFVKHEVVLERLRDKVSLTAILGAAVWGLLLASHPPRCHRWKRPVPPSSSIISRGKSTLKNSKSITNVSWTRFEPIKMTQGCDEHGRGPPPRRQSTILSRNKSTWTRCAKTVLALASDHVAGIIMLAEGSWGL